MTENLVEFQSKLVIQINFNDRLKKIIKEHDQFFLHQNITHVIPCKEHVIKVSFPLTENDKFKAGCSGTATRHTYS